MFYRVENGNLVKAPEKNIKFFIANPTEEQYRFLGYTDKVVEDEAPEMPELYEVYYEQIEGVIHKHYRKIEDIILEDEEV